MTTFARPDDHDPNCLFCRWLRKRREIDALGMAAAFEDGYPVTPRHVLIVPRRHVANGLAMTDEEIRDCEALIRRFVETIQQDDPTVTGFNIGMNIGTSAGQTIFHAHIHLIPRREGDTDDPKGGVRGVIPGKRRY